MSRKRNRNRKTMDSHPLNFSKVDLLDVAQQRAKWLDNVHPLDFLCVEKVRTSLNDATRGAFCELQWLWEQLEPADAILATCVDRRATALRKIPWDVVKKSGLTDAEDLLAESQLRTVTDFCNALENLEEAIAAFGQASFRGYRHVQLYETEYGDLRFNVTDNWNWARDGYSGPWQWNPDATFGLTLGKPLPVDQESIITRECPRPIDQPAMMLCLDRKNAKAQWLTYNGRYGVPPIFAIMPPGISEEVRKLYIEFARQCVSNAAGVLPAGSDVKAITPGVGGPDTFRLAIEQANQELVLRATGGLMTMLTAPGAGTNTETGSTHQDAFDDLADAEAHAIAAIIQERVIVPIIEQWHPGQPVLVEFELKRPDRDDRGQAVQNIAALGGAGYRTEADQIEELTGLRVTDAPASAGGMSLPAVNSLEKRYAPLMLWRPARKAFERACNAVRRAAEVRQAAEAARQESQAPAPPAEPALSERELGAFREMIGQGIDPKKLAEEAREAQRVLGAAVRKAQETAANSGTTTNEAESEKGEEAVAENCNQYGHDKKCPMANGTDAPEQEEKKEASQPSTTTWREQKFPEPTAWKPLTRAKRMNAANARKEIEAGVTITSKDGRELHIGKKLLEHFDGKDEKLRQHRLEDWPVMKEVLRSPHEIWEDEKTGQRIYIGRIERMDAKEAKGEKRYAELIGFTFSKSNELQTYFDASSPQKLSDMRAGILIYHNHRQE